ncbi:transposase InsO family protein [Arthrobacter sp. UYCu723]
MLAPRNWRAGLANASPASPSQQPPIPMVVPFQHRQIEVLRRPLETAQYTSIRYTDTLALEGLQPSIGSVGDAYDNAAAETVMGLFKNEAVAKDSPFRAGALKTETDVVEIVFEWVHSYNNQRFSQRVIDVLQDVA